MNISDLNFLIIYVIEYPLLAILFLISILLILSSFTYKGKKITLKNTRRLRYKRLFKYVDEFLQRIGLFTEYRKTLTRDLALITRKNAATNKIIASNIITTSVIIFLIILAVSFLLLRYILLKLLVPFALLSIYLLMFSYEFNRRRRLVQRDFADVVSVYTTQYAHHKHIRKAFQSSINEIPDSHKYEFSILISALGGSWDYVQALNEYAERINTTICHLFVQILKTAIESDDSILNDLIELELFIASDKESEMSRINKLRDKKLNLIVVSLFSMIAVVSVIFLLQDFAITFYFNTFLGQILILITITLTIITFVCVLVYEKII